MAWGKYNTGAKIFYGRPPSKRCSAISAQRGVPGGPEQQDRVRTRLPCGALMSLAVLGIGPGWRAEVMKKKLDECAYCNKTATGECWHGLPACDEHREHEPADLYDGE